MEVNCGLEVDHLRNQVVFLFRYQENLQQFPFCGIIKTEK